MSRLVEIPIDSMTLVKGAPASFVFRRQKVIVAEIVDRWVDGGRWWIPEPESDWWRIRSTTGGVYEIYRERTADRRWIMYKAYD